MANQTRSVSSTSPTRRVRSGSRGGSNRADRLTSRHADRNPRGGGPRRRRRRKSHRLLKWTLGLLGLVLVVGAAAFAYLYLTTEIIPPEKQALAQKTTVYYADGSTPIGTYADQNREIIDCAVLPKYVGNAVVSSENRSFYKDNGIDLKGIGRALLNNVTKGTRQGGSTITQQYAERYYLGETTTYKGKLREAILSLKISRTESKETVLCNYMNTIYFGRGAYGIQAAAQNYFGKDAKDLTMPGRGTVLRFSAGRTRAGIGRSDWPHPRRTGAQAYRSAQRPIPYAPLPPSSPPPSPQLRHPHRQ